MENGFGMASGASKFQVQNGDFASGVLQHLFCVVEIKNIVLLSTQQATVSTSFMKEAARLKGRARVAIESEATPRLLLPSGLTGKSQKTSVSEEGVGQVPPGF